jgi:NSS family neurotransmitter:Na+ symporter
MNSIRFSRIGFILAASGSAVGLGNIWKFPYMTGENGGGAFVLIYLLTIAFIGLSLFLAEVIMGRLSRSDVVSAFETLAPKNGFLWKYSGLMVANGVLILSFYLVVIGWIFKYIYIAATSLPQDIKESGAVFGGMVTTETTNQLVFFTLAFLITAFIVSKGIKNGIEKANIILMPLLVLIIVVLFFYSMSLDGFGQAIEFLFVPDFAKVNANSILAAVGHAFFTLSLGMGTIITYSASLPKDTNLVRVSAIVALLDTAIALIVGVVIFAIIFSFGAEPSQGPGLVFISLPAIFHEMGILGNLIGVSFFIALAFAGITSAVSILEPTVMSVINRFNVSRKKALIILGLLTYTLGTMALLSNIEDIKQYVTFWGTGFFDILDFLSASILLPLGGMLVAIFVGFVIEKKRIYSLLSPYMGDRLFNIWYFTIRFITPLGVMTVMINKLFS